jgi:hypothetical protein
LQFFDVSVLKIFSGEVSAAQRRSFLQEEGITTNWQELKFYMLKPNWGQK